MPNNHEHWLSGVLSGPVEREAVADRPTKLNNYHQLSNSPEQSEASVAGRSLKPLPDDGRPRTQFAQDLRKLRQQAGSPPYRLLVEKVGYTLATYSSMFNGVAFPELDQLLDLVGYLGGDKGEWSRRLAAAVAAEDRWKSSEDTGDELEALKAELEGYRVIASDPESIFAQAAKIQKDAQKRIRAASEMESNLRAVLAEIGNQLKEAHQSVPLAQEKSTAIIEQAKSTARDIEYRAHAKATTELNEAREEAKSLLDDAEAKASSLVEKAGVESRRMRADAGRIVDQLLQEGDQYLQEAREDRLQGELERQRGVAQAERMKLRAKVDLSQIIIQAQEKLLGVGGTKEAQLLDILLQDLGVSELPIDSGNLRGRHRKVPPEAPIEEVIPPLSEISKQSAAAKGPLKKAPLPQRRKSPGK
ncbi:hypothetical protein ACH4VS_29525 [Streptomyces hygroscopicus]|uniref:hypothetical protein n=1 Tax=Streptomyces hygroscopicus TaxID=1912 RepID=UPI00117FDF16|nr:hypothetical protein [Streptomyces hygroscopicus]